MPAKAASTHYTPHDVFNATSVSVAKLNQWIDRGTVILSRRDKKPSGSGDWRLISLETVHQVAITALGVRFGVPAKLAAEGARLLAVAQPGRQANAIFEHGRTLILFQPSGTRIVNSQYEESLADILGRLFSAATLVDVGQIIKATDEKLISIKRKGITK
jgi:hypothetical protein